MKQLAIYRIYTIVKMSVIFFLQIYFFQRKYRGNNSLQVQQKWERMVTKQAKIYNKTALSLGGLMIKVGQFLASRADIMPASFLAELEGLTDRVPPVPTDEAMRVLEAEWGRPIDAILVDISKTPVASASIGEVYKGRLHSGEHVAIKIQRPGIARIIAIDFRAMRIVIWLAKKFTSFSKQIDFNLLYKEMEDLLIPELNFLQELDNGRQFQTRFQSMPRLRIPSYYEEHSTTRVLVMEWVESRRISDTHFLTTHGINRQELSERLVTLFLQQVLVGGQFHADPHPGNLLVEPDGTLVLIDFGMVGKVTDEDAASIAKLAGGILFNNYEAVLDSLEEMEFLLPNANRAVLSKAIQKVVAAYESNELMKINGEVVEQLMEDLQMIVRTQPVQLPARFAFLGRAISTLAGVLYIVDPTVDLMAIAKPQIQSWVKEEASKDSFRQNIKQQLLQQLRLWQSFPNKVDALLDEPQKWRDYLKQHDTTNEARTKQRERKKLTLVFATFSLAALYVGIYTEHTLLVYSAAPTLLVSAIIYWK